MVFIWLFFFTAGRKDKLSAIIRMRCLYWTGYQTRSQFFANKQQILHGRKVSRFRQLIIYFLPYLMNPIISEIFRSMNYFLLAFLVLLILEIALCTMQKYLYQPQLSKLWRVNNAIPGCCIIFISSTHYWIHVLLWFQLMRFISEHYRQRLLVESCRM